MGTAGGASPSRSGSISADRRDAGSCCGRGGIALGRRRRAAAQPISKREGNPTSRRRPRHPEPRLLQRHSRCSGFRWRARRSRPSSVATARLRLPSRPGERRGNGARLAEDRRTGKPARLADGAVVGLAAAPERARSRPILLLVSGLSPKPPLVVQTGIVLATRVFRWITKCLPTRHSAVFAGYHNLADPRHADWRSRRSKAAQATPPHAAASANGSTTSHVSPLMNIAPEMYQRHDDSQVRNLSAPVTFASV